MKNIILTGYMGVGKSTIGKKLAENLSMEFIDMDVALELRIGMSIVDFFSHHGEQEFRQIESELCQELAAQENVVIATGGGTLINLENQSIFTENLENHIVNLQASLNTIRSRITKNEKNKRPLFDSKLKQRYQTRQPIYLSFPYQIDTENKTINQICNEIDSIFKFTQLNIKTPTNQYPIYIGNHCISNLISWLRKSGFENQTKICLITDSIIQALHAEKVNLQLKNAGYDTTIISMPSGEEHKNINTVMLLIDKMLQNNFDRHSLIIALGGGIVTDLAGFVAATFMRGIPHIQIPTSLLAMIDASIGGKTGVNLHQGKNLIGAFKQPELVVIDNSFLQTLPQIERINGLAEAIKHGIIASPNLFKFLEESAGDWSFLLSDSKWIVETIQVKKEIVEKDPFEKNIRAYLNLGHTAGHAIEKQSNYRLKHGQAVAIGTLIAAQLSLMEGILSLKQYNRIKNLLLSWGLPITINLDSQIIYQICQYDKKKHGKSLRWVLPQKIGNVYITNEITDNQALVAISTVLKKIEE